MLHTPPAEAQLHCYDVTSLAPGQSTWPKAAQLQIDDRLAARAGQCDEQQPVSQQGVDSQWFVSLQFAKHLRKKKALLNGFFYRKKNVPALLLGNKKMVLGPA
jgi:hypothetical protein